MQPDVMQPPETPVAQPQATESHPVPKPTGLATASLILSIVGLLTVWLFGLGIILAIISIILAAVSLAKHHGGKGMSIAGIIVSSVAIVFGGVLIFISMVAYSGIQQRSSTSSNAATAALVTKKVRMYSLATRSDVEAQNWNYPTYTELMTQTTVKEAQLNEQYESQVHDGAVYRVSNITPVTYTGCSAGATISYWNADEDHAEVTTLGRPQSC